MKNKENNELWRKLSYQIEKEKLDKQYYSGLLTVEELIRLLRELKDKIYPSEELKKEIKKKIKNPDCIVENALKKIEAEIIEQVRKNFKFGG